MDVKLINFNKKRSRIVDVKFKKGCKIIEPVNLYGCELGKNIFIGPFVEIQKRTIIKDNTRIQSHSFICEQVTIGKNCFISHGVMFINDTFKKGKVEKNPNKFKKTTIGNNVIIGSNSTILPVKISNGVVIGAGSVVTKNINVKGIYAGNPAMLIRKL